MLIRPSWLLLERTLDLLPHNTNELNAVSHLFPQRDCIRAEIFCLPQSKRSDTTGVLQPPIFGRLGVTRRCHVFAHLVEVMGLCWGSCDVQLFNVHGSDVDDLIDVLKFPLDQ
jgi:hypothetical protein